MPVTTNDTPTYRTVARASVPRRPCGRSRAGLRVSSLRFATASKPLYAKNTTAAAVSTPAKPNADGATPKSTWIRGRVPPWALGSAPWAGGTNGCQFADFTKNAPATMMNTQMTTFTATNALVTQADSRMPMTATVPRTATMAIAPTLTSDVS